MPCKKKGYSKVEAQTMLNARLREGTFLNGYGRIYECDLCGKWHLTSHVKEPTGASPVRLQELSKWKNLLR